MALTADTSTSTYQPLPPQTYIMRLVDIEEKSGQYGPYWLWKFEIPESELPDQENGKEWKSFQFLFTSNATNPERTFKVRTRSPRVAAEALLGRKLLPTEFLEGDEYLDLIDRKCQGTITTVDVNGVTRNDIAALVPLRGQRASIPPPVEQDPLWPADEEPEAVKPASGKAK